MAEPAGSLVSALLRRVRDAGGIAVTRDYARQIVSLSQQHVNAGLQLVIEEQHLTTRPMLQLYPISIGLPSAVKVMMVQAADGGTTFKRELDPIAWNELAMVDRKWFRRTGPRFEAFATFGRGILILTPALEITDAVKVTYTKWTNELIQDQDVTELPDHHLMAVLDLAEIIMSIRLRQFEPAKMTMKRFAERFKVEVADVMDIRKIRKPPARP